MQYLRGRSKILRQRIQPAETMVDVFERLRRGSLLPAFKWTKTASNTYCNYEEPMV
jgi:hypothetical protein